MPKCRLCLDSGEFSKAIHTVTMRRRQRRGGRPHLVRWSDVGWRSVPCVLCTVEKLIQHGKEQFEPSEETLSAIEATIVALRASL